MKEVDISEEVKNRVKNFCDLTGEPYPVTQEDYDAILARMKAVGI